MSKQAELERQLKKVSMEYRKFNAEQQEFAIKEIGRIRLEIIDMLSSTAAAMELLRSSA
ncbi:hypothetical protein QKW52_29095 [Bacillus sonorensis]|nr:hypothetical protein [Bacillus sonorensis]